MTDGRKSGLPEHWADFGSQVNRFFSREGESLRSRQYNVIMGFTRGGAILANILSSELTDRFPEVYGIPSKGAIRTIPNGIHKKGYDRSDFVKGVMKQLPEPYGHESHETESEYYSFIGLMEEGRVKIVLPAFR